MPGFINTSYNQTITSLVDGFKDRLNNPYNMHLDKSPVIVDYYNQNITKSTLDDAAKISYNPLSSQAPIRYNLIKDALLYGIDRLPIDLNAGEFGLEAEGVTGEAIILPNTWVPIPDDYFTIVHTTHRYLFKVDSVDINTLESGANFYKISFKYDRPDDKDIHDQIEDTFKMIVNNVGTEFNTIVRSNDYDFIQLMDTVLSELRKYYKAIFYRDRVQTFVFEYVGNFFYDPCMIEFMIRNNIMNDNNLRDYIYIDHAMNIPSTFAIEYNNSFFKGLESCDNSKFKTTLGYGVEIVDPMSLLSTRKEPYFRIRYDLHDFLQPIEIIEASLVNRINNNNKFGDYDKELAINNILIDYFNNKEVDPKYISMLNNIDYNDNKELFYLIPMIIFILEKRVKNLLR